FAVDDRQNDGTVWDRKTLYRKFYCGDYRNSDHDCISLFNSRSDWIFDGWIWNFRIISNDFHSRRKSKKISRCDCNVDYQYVFYSGNVFGTTFDRLSCTYIWFAESLYRVYGRRIHVYTTF